MDHICPKCGQIAKYLPYGKMAAVGVTSLVGKKAAKSFKGFILITLMSLVIGAVIDHINKTCPDCGVLFQALV